MRSADRIHMKHRESGIATEQLASGAEKYAMLAEFPQLLPNRQHRRAVARAARKAGGEQCTLK